MTHFQLLINQPPWIVYIRFKGGTLYLWLFQIEFSETHKLLIKFCSRPAVLNCGDFVTNGSFGRVQDRGWGDATGLWWIDVRKISVLPAVHRTVLSQQRLACPQMSVGPIWRNRSRQSQRYLAFNTHNLGSQQKRKKYCLQTSKVSLYMHWLRTYGHMYCFSTYMKNILSQYIGTVKKCHGNGAFKVHISTV